VTLDAEARKEANIPERATHFAFAYPLDALSNGRFEKLVDKVGHFERLHSFENKNKLQQKRDEKKAWFHFLGFGGFAYFEKDEASQNSYGTLLQLNAITFKKSAQLLHLHGPYPAHAAAVHALHQSRRLRPVTARAIRVVSGYTEFAWVNPKERFQSEIKPGYATTSARSDHCGELWLGDEMYEHGAFVYTNATGAPTYFTISPKKADETVHGAATWALPRPPSRGAAA
jgi:hypothetical protein